MIVVTGATGQLGSGIVKALRQRVPADRIVASTRNPDKATDLGVQVRRGDYTDAESLRQAFAGADQVLLISSNAAIYGGDPLVQHRTAIEAARSAGACRILYTAHMAASPTSLFTPMHTHAATEELLAACGVPWTSLRNGFYATRAQQEATGAMKSGMIEAPQDGKVAYTTHGDLAEAAAVILADEGRFDGPTPALTGGESFDMSDLAALLTDLLGRPIQRQTVSNGELEAKITARGLPPMVAKMTTGFYAATRAGEFATVDPTLKQLLSREPETLRSFLASRLTS